MKTTSQKIFDCERMQNLLADIDSRIKEAVKLTEDNDDEEMEYIAQACTQAGKIVEVVKGLLTEYNNNKNK